MPSAAPNNSFNPTGNSLPFIRESWMLGSVSPGGLIRALGGSIEFEIKE
jgi:hypothetical protein